jgi:hypothetical protein
VHSGRGRGRTIGRERAGRRHCLPGADVAHTGLPEAIRPEAQQIGREIEADDLAHVRRKLLRHVGRPTCHVEDDHVLVQRFDPTRGRPHPTAARHHFIP